MSGPYGERIAFQRAAMPIIVVPLAAVRFIYRLAGRAVHGYTALAGQCCAIQRLRTCTALQCKKDKTPRVCSDVEIGCGTLFLSVNAAELRRVFVLRGVFLVESST
jgi:hypothetical protein